MIVIVLVALAVSVVLLLDYIAARPDTFRVERATVIEAPPEQIFPYLEDFRRFREWWPNKELDSATSRTYSGAKKGKGAVYEWNGRGKVGKGRMEIAHVSVPHMVVIRVDCVKPFASHNTVQFTLNREGAATRVIWVMRGANSYAEKLLQVYVNMDQLLGNDFENVLAALKAVVEQQSSYELPRFASAG